MKPAIPAAISRWPTFVFSAPSAQGLRRDEPELDGDECQRDQNRQPGRERSPAGRLEVASQVTLDPAVGFQAEPGMGSGSAASPQRSLPCGQSIRSGALERQNAVVLFAAADHEDAPRPRLEILQLHAAVVPALALLPEHRLQARGLLGAPARPGQAAGEGLFGWKSTLVV